MACLPQGQKGGRSSASNTCPQGNLTCWIRSLDVYVDKADPLAEIQADEDSQTFILRHRDDLVRLDLRWIDASLIWDIYEQQEPIPEEMLPDAMVPVAMVRDAAGPMTYEPFVDTRELVLDYTDPTACQPAFCITMCHPDRTCSSRGGCTSAIPDGFVSGVWRSSLGYSAEPEVSTETFDAVVWPISIQDCEAGRDPIAGLEQGNNPVVIGPPVTIPQEIKGPEGTGTGTGTGGGGNNGSQCSLEVCYASNCSQLSSLAGQCSSSGNPLTCNDAVRAGSSCFNVTTGTVTATCPPNSSCRVSCGSNGWPSGGSCQ